MNLRADYETGINSSLSYGVEVTIYNGAEVVNKFLLDSDFRDEGKVDRYFVKNDLGIALNRCLDIYTSLSNESFFDLTKEERALRSDMKKVLFSYHGNLSNSVVNFVKRAEEIRVEKNKRAEMLSKDETLSKKQERVDKIKKGVIKVITAPLKFAEFVVGAIGLSILVYVPKAIMKVPELLEDFKGRVIKNRMRREDDKLLEN